MIRTEQIAEEIKRNSAELSKLHDRVRETFKHRNESSDSKANWHKAAEEFRTRYDVLAFPGSYEGALDRVVSGDELAMEAAICFLELRPYFFRSGYMFKDLLRKCRKAPLSAEQKARFQAIENNYSDWRDSRRKTKLYVGSSTQQGT